MINVNGGVSDILGELEDITDDSTDGVRIIIIIIIIIITQQ